MQYINIGMTLDRNGSLFVVVVPLRKVIDKQHAGILRFLNADIRPLEKKISAYIENVMRGARYNVPDEIYKEFSALHPYYALNEANISTSLNRAFAGVIMSTDKSGEEKTQQMELLYADRGLENECNTIEWFHLDPLRIEPEEARPGEPLYQLKETQKSLKEAAVLLLDDSPSLQPADPYKRLVLYGAISNDGFGGPSDGFIRLGRMTSIYGCVQDLNSRDFADRLDFAEYTDVLTISNLQKDIASLAEDKLIQTPAITEAISSLNGDKRLRLDEILIPASFEELLLYEIKEMFTDGIKIHRGKSGKFEVPELVPPRTEAVSLEQELQSEYRKAYKTHHRRAANEIISMDQFNEWVSNAKEMRQKTWDGEISIGEFTMWSKK